MVERQIIEKLKIEMAAEDAAAYLGRRAAKLDMDAIIDAVNRVGNPKFVIKEMECEVKDDCVLIGETEFASSQLAEELKGKKSVLLYAATAGTEVIDCDEIENPSIRDILTTALFVYSKKVLGAYLEKKIGGKDWTELKPGVVADWPVSANIDICRMIGNTEEIGISLNDAGYMAPINSNAGILVAKN